MHTNTPKAHRVTFLSRHSGKQGQKPNHQSKPSAPHRKLPSAAKHAQPKPQNTVKQTQPSPYQITLAEDSDEDVSQIPGHQIQNQPAGTEGDDDEATGLTKLQSNLAAKLTGSRFRVLNEELYTTTSEESFKRFQANPELFNDYHVGFREQTTGWNEFRNSKPKKDKKDKKDKQKKDKHKEGANANANANTQAEGGVNGNPVNWIIEFIRRGASSPTGGPSGSSVTVADFGCGDAAIALSLTSKKSKNSSQTNFIVHSLDMVTPPPPSPLSTVITACNIARTPLKDKSVDIGVYSLALMGTDIYDILSECSRVMKLDGVVYISEVRSRFNREGDGDMLPRFMRLMEVLGFECVNGDARRKNMFFVLMIFKKVTNRRGKEKDIEGEGEYLKPCIYKRR